MPFDLQWEKTGVYRRYFGHVTHAERKGSFAKISGDARFDQLQYMITDFLAIDSCEIVAEATEERAAHYIGAMMTNPRLKLAAVATDERIVADIRHFMSLGFISQPYLIFSTIVEARAWVATARANTDGLLRRLPGAATCQ